MAASTVLTSVSNWSEWHSDLRIIANANGIWPCIRRNERVSWLQRPGIDAAEDTWRKYQRQLDSDRAVRGWIMDHVSPGIRSFLHSAGHYELSYLYDRLIERLNITPERLTIEGQKKRANSLMARTTIPANRNRESASSAMTDIALSDIETSSALRKPQTKRVTKKRVLTCGICGTLHHDIYGCFYIHKHLRPEWFKPNIEISEHIVAELRKPNSDIVNLVKRAKNPKKEYEDPADVSEELLLRQY